MVLHLKRLQVVSCQKVQVELNLTKIKNSFKLRFWRLAKLYSIYL